jgi:hypothetical protein
VFGLSEPFTFRQSSKIECVGMLDKG